jgi:hypothetical protein
MTKDWARASWTDGILGGRVFSVFSLAFLDLSPAMMVLEAMALSATVAEKGERVEWVILLSLDKVGVQAGVSTQPKLPCYWFGN